MITTSTYLPSAFYFIRLSKLLLFLLLLVEPTSPLRAQQANLVAHYTFNGSTSDQSGHSNHAINNGATFTTDRFGTPNKAIGFNGCGSTQFLRVPNSSSLQATSAMTISFWARVDLSSGMDPGTGACNSNGRHVFFAKAGDGWNTSLPGMVGLTYQANNKQKVYLEAPTDKGITAISGERDLPASSAWHYYTYVITSTQVNLYVDAQLVHTSNQATSFAEANGQDLYLGVMGPKTSPVLGISYWYPLKGAMDEVRVYSRALNTQEITTLYQAWEEGCSAPSVSASTYSICAGNSSTLYATGCTGTTRWNTGQTGTSLTVYPSSTTTYSATCNVNGCTSNSSSLTVYVTQRPANVTLTAGSTSICSGSGTMLYASNCSGTVYWSTGSSGSSIYVSPTSSTTYSAYCYANGCTSYYSSTISIYVTPRTAAPTVSSSSSTICAGSSTTLTATNCSGTINWSNGSTGSSISVSPSSTTTYSATCTVNGCTSNTSSATIAVNPVPAAPTLTASSSYICAGSGVTLWAQGCSGTVNWGTGHTGTSSITVTPKTTSTYGAWCVNASGCSSKLAQLTVNVQGVIPTIRITSSVGTTIKPGTSVTFTASATNGGSSPIYRWQKNGDPVGSNSTVYTDATLKEGDRISCLLISNAPCRQADQVASNFLDFKTLTFESDGSCVGSTISLSDHSYTSMIWKRNGKPIDNPISGYARNGIIVAGAKNRFISKTDYSDNNTYTNIFKDAAGTIYADSLRWAPGSMEAESATGGEFIDTHGNAYRIDKSQHRILKFTQGSKKGITVAGGNGAGIAANQLNTPNNIYVDAVGNIYVSDTENHRIQRWSPGSLTGITVAGGNGAGSATNQLNRPKAIYVDHIGNIYIYDSGNRRVQKWVFGATSGTTLTITPPSFYSFEYPGDLSGDLQGNIYYMQAHPFYPMYDIKRWHPSSQAETSIIFFACGSGYYCYTNGYYIDSKGNAIVARSGRLSGRGYDLRIDGIVTSSPGTTDPTTLINGYGAGNAANQLSGPINTFVDTAGNLFIADIGNNRIQKWAPGASSGSTVTSNIRTSNQYITNIDFTVDAAGNVYIVDADNHQVQKRSLGSISGITVAGGNGAGNAANQLSSPGGIVIDASGNIYIADKANHRIQKWAPGATNGITVAGGNGAGNAANQLSSPNGVFVDVEGNIYVADTGNKRIQRWAPGTTSGTTVANSYKSFYGTTYEISASAVYVDKSGNIYSNDHSSDYYVIKWVPGSVSGEAISVSSRGSSPVYHSVDATGSIYLSNYDYNYITKRITQSNKLQIKEPGVYTAEVVTDGATVVTNAITIKSSNTAPTLSATSTTLCNGTSTTLSATNCAGSVQWSTGETGISIVVSPVGTTTYTATCTVNGCTSASSDPLTISVSGGTICQSVTSGSWNNAGTWSCGRLPLPCDDVVIQPAHVVTLDAEGKANTIQIHNPSNLQFLNGGHLRIGNQ